MALPTVTLNESSPAGTAYVRDGDDRICEYKKQVREIMEVDHYFPSSGQNDACGRHKWLTLIEATDIGTGVVGGVGVPAITALGGQTVSGKSELVYTDEDDTDVILTDVGKIALQNGRLPNNTYLIARNFAGAANVNIIKVNASDVLEMSIALTASAAITIQAGLLVKESAAPTTAADHGAIYTKNDGTQTELYFREESAGDEVQVTKAGYANAAPIAYIKVSDVKAQNTDGGTFTLGAWRTRVINTEDTDTGNHCSIAANQITLAAGTYECLIRCPAYAVNENQARLYNISDAGVTLLGSSLWVRAGSYSMGDSIIQGRFTIAAQKIFEIQHYCLDTQADTGFGRPANIGSEVYTVAEFRKVA